MGPGSRVAGRRGGWIRRSGGHGEVMHGRASSAAEESGFHEMFMTFISTDTARVNDRGPLV